jgi:hypothetical protein
MFIDPYCRPFSYSLDSTPPEARFATPRTGDRGRAPPGYSAPFPDTGRAAPRTAPCDNSYVGWLERMDARNQRRMERLQTKLDAQAEQPDGDGGAAVAVGSYLSFIPSLIGLAALLLMLVGGVRHHRREHRS